MSIKATCHCGAQFMAQPELAGKVVRCPSCGQSFQVPKPAAVSRQLTVACACGKTYPVKPELYGRQVRCQACGRQFLVPTPGKTSASAAPDPLGMNNPLDGLGDLSNWGTPASAPMNMAMGASTRPSTSYSTPVAKAKRKSSFKLNSKLISSIGLSLLAIAAIAGIGVAGYIWWPFGGYQSPQAVFDAHFRAQANGDWKTAYDTLTPESQSLLVGTLAGLLKTFSAFDPQLNELLTKHGVTAGPGQPLTPDFGNDPGKMFAQMQQEMKTAGDSIKDKRAFFVEMMSLAEEMSEKRGAAFKKIFDRPGGAELKDVVIDGDTARGSATIGGRSFAMPISFRKINGGWRIEMPGLSGTPGSVQQGFSAVPGTQSAPGIPSATSPPATTTPNPASNPSRGQSYDSPAAVLTAHKQAYVNEDWATVFDTVTPEGQSQLAFATQPKAPAPAAGR